jgi:DeoR/GlpR family transcriptional regulator of sugar metabolism
MFAEERRETIVAELTRHGRVEVAELALRLEVSEDTIRRDLRALQAQGYLQKTHGGAVALDTPHLAWSLRARVVPEAKANIGARAAQLVEPGQTVILDAGSTILEMARHLKLHSRDSRA